MAILFIKGYIDVDRYKTFCTENSTSAEKAVFIFPGNNSHHGKGHNLHSRKSGAGLAQFTSKLGEGGYPVLSLPTTGMGNWKNSSEIQAIVGGAVEDLWKAVGAGYDLVLPVRDLDPLNRYFAKELAKKLDNLSVEPSFWGLNLTTPNIPLADYYIEQLNLLAAYMDVKGTDKEGDFLTDLEKNHSNLKQALVTGQTMKEDDPWLAKPASKSKPVGVISEKSKHNPKKPSAAPPMKVSPDFFIKLKNKIEEKRKWDVGLFGGVTVTMDDNTQKVMPHHVAKLYEVSRNAKNSTYEQDLEKVNTILSARNIPKGVVGWIKYVLKSVDFFQVFSRQQTTEGFYKEIDQETSKNMK